MRPFSWIHLGDAFEILKLRWWNILFTTCFQKVNCHGVSVNLPDMIFCLQFKILLSSSCPLQTCWNLYPIAVLQELCAWASVHKHVVELTPAFIGSKMQESGLSMCWALHPTLPLAARCSEEFQVVFLKLSQAADWAHTVKALLMQNPGCCWSKSFVCTNILN